MDNKYKWHFNDKDYLEFAENNVTEFKSSFNYKSYITPHSEMRELIVKIIEELPKVLEEYGYSSIHEAIGRSFK